MGSSPTSGGAEAEQKSKFAPGLLTARERAAALARPATPLGAAIVGGFGACALLAAVATFVDVLDGGLGEPILPIVSIVCSGTALFVGRNGLQPPHGSAKTILLSTVLAWLYLILISTVVYWASGTLDRFDDALFESVAGFTTTHLSVIPDIESVSRPVLFWRAGTQWIGGLCALGLGTIVLPFWIGGREMADPAGQVAGYRSFAPTPVAGMVNLLKFYGGFTLLAVLIFMVGTRDVFDGVTYGMTTASTGGFANHPNSLAYFDSALLEWLVGILMLISGAAVALVWWVVRGQGTSVIGSLELRLYLTVVAGATVVFGVANADNEVAFWTALRHAFVTSTSVLSTTGHWTTDWSLWGTGSQALLLLLVAIGSMAGSIGGGFRWLHVIESLKFVRRELMLQLHPTAQIAIKVGKRRASDRSLDQLNSQQSLIFTTIGFGAVALAIFGADLITALSVAVSALSTFGPALGDLAGSSDAGVLSAPARFFTAVLMFAGRVSIYPIPLALGTLVIMGQRGARGLRNLWDRYRPISRSHPLPPPSSDSRPGTEWLELDR